MIEPEADIFSDWQTVDTHTKSFKDYVDAEGTTKQTVFCKQSFYYCRFL